MPKSTVRRRPVAVTVATALVGVSTAVFVPAAGPAPDAHAAVAPGVTALVSAMDGPDAATAELGGYQQELAAGGSAVVFTSDSKLDDIGTAPEGTEFGYENVYVRDLNTDRTLMISRGQFTWPTEPVITAPHASAVGPEPIMGEVPPDQDSYQPTISADGRFVAFVTTATNIVPGDNDHDQDIIVCDRDPDSDGTFDEVKENGDRDYRYFRVTAPRYGDEGDYRVDDPRWPKLSDDASRIVWQDQYQEEGDGYSRERVRTAVLRGDDRSDDNGALRVPGPPLVAGWVHTPLGDEVLEDQGYPDVSGDGRFVVLVARYRIATQNPYDDEARHSVVWRVDTENNDTLARVDDVGKPISYQEEVFLSAPVISRDGSVVAFEAEKYHYDPCDGTCWDRDGFPDVHLARLADDGTVTGSRIVSRDNAGEQVNGIAPGLSADGRFVSFVTDNHDAHDGVDDPDGQSCLFRPRDGGDDVPAPPEGPREDRTSCQLVVRDLVVDGERVSAKQPRLPGSLASPGTGRCVDSMPEGARCGGNGNTTPYRTEKSPTLAEDGSLIVFESDATDLVAGKADDNRAQDVFVRWFRPELRADPSPLDFDEVVVDTPATATVRLDHVGIGPLAVRDLKIEGDGFTVLDQTCVNEGVRLQQAGNCLAEIEFLPTAESGFQGVLRVTLIDKREFTVDLVGTGVAEDPEEPEVPAAAAFSAGPDPVSFGSRLIRSNGPSKTVTVTNTGGTPLTVSGVTVEPPAARLHYTVTGNTCAGAPVAPGRTCVVTVRLIPAASGNLPAVLSFADSAAGSPHLVGLTASAPAPEIAVSPAVTPPGRVVTVTGTGFAPNRQVVVSAELAIQTDPVVAKADGTFTAALLVLPKAAIGGRAVVAKVTVFPEVNGEKPLLVVTPTVGPAEFVVRG